MSSSLGASSAGAGPCAPITIDGSPACFSWPFTSGRSLVITAFHFVITAAPSVCAPINARMASSVGAASPSFIAEKIFASFLLRDSKSVLLRAVSTEPFRSELAAFRRCLPLSR